MTITDVTPLAPELPGLRALSTDELAAAWRDADVDDPAVYAAFSAEFTRRTAAERRERAERQLHDDWYDAMHAQRSAFEAEGIGYLLNAEGKRRGISEWALWTGEARLVEEYGTDEVKDFFARWPRLTLTEYKRRRKDADRIQRREWRDRDEISKGESADGHGNGTELAGHDGGALRQEPDLAQRNADGGGPGTVRPGRRGGSDAEAAREDAAADGRAGGPVQRDGRVKGAEDMGVVRAARTVARADRTLKAKQDAKQGTQRRALPVPRQEVAVPQPAQAARGAVPLIPGDQLLDLVRDAWLGWFARFPSPAALDAVTLWAAHCWMRDENGVLMFRASPRLYLLSSEPGSGKSFVLELLMRIVPACHGLDLEPTKAGLVHTISKEHATVLLDEGDLLFAAGQRHAGVRAVINGGTYRYGTVLDGKGGKAHREPAFGALALAGLDVMEKGTGDTLKALMSRGVKIRMEKASGEDRPPRLTRKAEESADGAKVWLERWAAQVRDEVADAEPEVPEGVEGRAEDIWTPLLAVAEAAGGDWPERARAACLELALGKPDGGEDLEDQFAQFAGSFGGL